MKQATEKSEIEKEIEEQGINYPRKYFGELGSVPYMKLKHKCPCCKKRVLFKRIDIDCDREFVYYEGGYMPLYRCENCWVIIGFGIKAKIKRK